MKILDTSGNRALIEIDFCNATDDELDELCHLIPKHNLILAQNQTVDKIKAAKAAQRMAGFTDEQVRSRDWLESRYGKFFYTDEDNAITFRVTNERNAEGKIQGLFADYELGWHCNNTAQDEDDKHVVMMLMDRPGDPDYGITSFVNTKLAYEELDPVMRKLVDEIEIEISFDAFRGKADPLHQANDAGYPIPPEDPLYDIFARKAGAKPGFFKPLVCGHPWHEGRALYFLPNSITGWRHKQGKKFNSKGLWNYLIDHVYNERYMYHHRWSHGDLIINDQYFGFHKRTEPRGDRWMWRWCIPTKGFIQY